MFWKEIVIFSPSEWQEYCSALKFDVLYYRLDHIDILLKLNTNSLELALRWIDTTVQISVVMLCSGPANPVSGRGVWHYEDLFKELAANSLNNCAIDPMPYQHSAIKSNNKYLACRGPDGSHNSNAITALLDHCRLNMQRALRLSIWNIYKYW